MMKILSFLRFQWLSLSAIIVFLDQFTKHLVLKYLALNQSVALAPFLNLSLTFNHGAVFGFLNNAAIWPRYFLMVFTGILTLIVFVWMLRAKSKQPLLLLGLALIFGGALANLFDRVTIHYVVDFIDFYISDWHWPVFNVADSAICCGVAFVLLHLSCENKVQK
jgi:signal peptidase II